MIIVLVILFDERGVTSGPSCSRQARSLNSDKLLRARRQVQPAARAEHVDCQNGAAVPPVADANETAVGKSGRQDAELDRILPRRDKEACGNTAAAATGQRRASITSIVSSVRSGEMASASISSAYTTCHEPRRRQG